MLGVTYRFTILNQTGQNGVTASVKSKRWKVGSDNALAQEASEGTVATISATNNNAYGSGAAVDNATDKWRGGDFSISVTAPASSNGSVYVYFERSTDGGTTWDTNGLGDVLYAFIFTTNGTKVKTIEL